MFTLIAVVGKGVMLLRRYITPTDNSMSYDQREENPGEDIEENLTTAPNIQLEGCGNYCADSKETDIIPETFADYNQRNHSNSYMNGTEINQCNSLESSKETKSTRNETDMSSPLTLCPQQTAIKNSLLTDNVQVNTDYVSDNVNHVSQACTGFGFSSSFDSGDASLAQSKATGMGRREVGGNEAKIMVKNIPFKVKVSELRRFFGSFDKVVDVYLLKEHLKHKSRSKGMAFVTFSSAEGVKRVMIATEQELTLRERVLRIEYAEPKSHRKQFQIEEYNPGVKSKQEQFEDAFGFDNKAGSLTDTYDMCSDDALIHKLYDEILIRIFVLLQLRDRIMIQRVCKRWYTVGRSSWQSVESLTFTNIFKGFKFAAADDDSTPVGLTDQILRSVLLLGCRNLRSLDLSASPHLLTYRSLELIEKRCPRLEHLNLTGISVTNATLRQLSQRCNKLKTLILQRCLGVGEKGFWWLFHNCPRLEYIDVRESKRFRGKCFHILNSSCHTIISSGCSRLDDSSVYELTTKCSTHLKCLDLSNCYHITDKSLRLIGQNCTQLNKLDLSGLVQTVTPIGLCSLSLLTELVELRLNQNIAVNDEVLVKLGENCKKLQLIDISACYDGVHDAGLQGLAGCMQLEVININYLDQITDDGLKHLANSCSQLKKISARGCILLTDEGMLHLANQCSLLQQVDVSGCEKLTNVMLDSFLFSKQNVEEEETKLHLTVGGTDIEADYATKIVQTSNGHLEISTYNLAVSIKRFCTEAFFGSDDLSDDEENLEEAAAAEGEVWPDDINELPPGQFADADAELDQLNFVNPLPAGYHERERQAEERWDVRDDFVNDYLDADDPSMWDEEEWMLS